MLIWRGMGILAPIIYALAYFMLYGFLKLFATPSITHGWFVYVGSIVAGGITYLLGSSINAEIYTLKKMHPRESINSHSFFFIPMEYCGLVFMILAFIFGFKNTQQINRYAEDEKLAQERRQVKFDKKVYVIDSLIQYPEKGDFFLTNFEGTYTLRGREKNKNYAMPLKVTDFNETQIELFCPVYDPTAQNLKYHNKKELLEVFSSSTEEGYKTWVDKSILKKAVTRQPYNRNINKVSIPSLIATAPITLTDIWQINGPEFKQHTWDWNNKSRGIRLELKNIGLPATMQKVLLNGKKITWKKRQNIGRGNIKQKGVDYSKDDVIRMEQYFYIEGDGTAAGPNPMVEIFCSDNQGRSFRFEIKKRERVIKIKRYRL